MDGDVGIGKEFLVAMRCPTFRMTDEMMKNHPREIAHGHGNGKGKGEAPAGGKSGIVPLITSPFRRPMPANACADAERTFSNVYTQFPYCDLSRSHGSTFR